MNPVQETTVPKKEKKRRLVRRILFIVAGLFVFGFLASALAMIAADRRVESCAADRVFTSVEDVPSREFGLLLGTTRLVKGKYRNDYFYKRIRAAADLYHAGKIRKIIVSGDNSRTDYNETGDMKRELIAEGIPADHVLMDYAGFCTLDSVVRARNLYGASALTVISQEFHVERAVYLAAQNGIDAIGFAAEDSSVKSARLRLAIRESLARVRAVLDAELLHSKPHFEF